MQIYQIHMQELQANVKFKVLTTTEISNFLSSLTKAQKKDLRKTILQHVVFNLATDVAGSLSVMSRPAAERSVEALYAGCIMLNPGLDLDYWMNIAYSTSQYDPSKNLDASFDEVRNMIKSVKDARKKTPSVSSSNKKITKQKFLGLENYLKNNIIGQDEAIEKVVAALARSQAELHDPNKPTGIFLFAGASGVGKTHLANLMQKYLYGEDTVIVRIDCGEFQHKHENQKLLGSPPGFVGHDEGGQLTNQIKKNPYTVVLLDEVEKAHQDIWSTFLRIFDEGLVTDGKGELVNFRNSIIILTTNLGNDKVVDSMRYQGIGLNKHLGAINTVKELPSRSIVEKNTLDAVYKYFKPELLNRIDNVVVFNHLTNEDYCKIAQIELAYVAEKLSKKGLSLHYTDNVISGLINSGLDLIKGARGISQARREKLETPLAKVIVESHIPKGTIFHIDYLNDNFIFDIKKPTKILKDMEKD